MMYFSCKEGKAVNVYDFDNTIYDGESGFDIFMFYLKRIRKKLPSSYRVSARRSYATKEVQ